MSSKKSIPKDTQNGKKYENKEFESPEPNGAIYLHPIIDNGTNILDNKPSSL